MHVMGILLDGIACVVLNKKTTLCVHKSKVWLP